MLAWCLIAEGSLTLPIGLLIAGYESYALFIKNASCFFGRVAKHTHSLLDREPIWIFPVLGLGWPAGNLHRTLDGEWKQCECWRGTGAPSPPGPSGGQAARHAGHDDARLPRTATALDYVAAATASHLPAQCPVLATTLLSTLCTSHGKCFCLFFFLMKISFVVILVRLSDCGVSI